MAGGPEQFAALAAKCRATADRGLRNAVRRDIRATAKPLTEAVRQAAREKLPHGGGLNEVVANQRVTVSVLFGARSAGVRLRTRDTGGSKRDNRGTDEGVVRHPVFKDRKRWVAQSIPNAAGWWSQTLARKGPVVGAAVGATVERISAELARL